MEHLLEEKLEKLGIQINEIQRKQFDDFTNFWLNGIK